ncbi:PD-(D/E)XK nuclease family transposase [Leptonema illini]
MFAATVTKLCRARLYAGLLINFQSPIIQNPELPGEAIDDKNAILDILARDSRGRRINIEMQAHVTVRAMLKKGYPFNEISGITGLTVQDLET